MAPSLPSLFPWEPAYYAAILEEDDSLLAARIAHAEEAITRRLWKMPRIPENEEERVLANRVLASLVVLRHERLTPKSRHEKLLLSPVRIGL